MHFQPSPKTPKFQQIVWVDAEVFKWIIELSAERGIAPNVIISQLIRACYEGSQTGKIQPILTVERKVKIYRCLFCEYESLKWIETYDHMIQNHKDKLREMIET